MRVRVRARERARARAHAREGEYSTHPRIHTHTSLLLSGVLPQITCAPAEGGGRRGRTEQEEREERGGDMREGWEGGRKAGQGRTNNVSSVLRK